MSGFGRPQEYDRETVAIAFAAYIVSEEIPIVAEFAANQGFGKSLMYEWAKEDKDFLNLLNKCTTKKESALERKGLKGEVNTPMAIFSLKQLGWSDKQEQTLKGDPTAPLNITVADAKL